MQRLLFKGIHIVNPHDGIDAVSDVLIGADGVISAVDKSIPTTDDADIHDASQWVMCPGLFDMHVHLREPGATQKEDIASGTAAAANGGFTGVCCMPNTTPNIDAPEVVHSILMKSHDNLVEVIASAGITLNRAGDQLSPMGALYDAGVRLFTDDGDCVMSSETMRRAFEYAAMFPGAVLSQHCEEKSMTRGFVMNEGATSTRMGLPGYPNIAEELIIARDIMISQFCGDRPYHVSHMSTAGGVSLVRQAKASGRTNITCEVTPHHFAMTDDAVEKYGANAKMNPPLRTSDDVAAILEGLSDGTVDVIATDHAPHTMAEKEVELPKAPNGIIGLETALGLSCTELLHKNRVTLSRLIELMSINPRKILSLPIPKIGVGEQANITIFAPNQEWTVDINKSKSKSRNSPFDGWKLKGRPVMVVRGGNVQWSTI